MNAIRIDGPALIQVPASASLMAREPSAILFDALGTLLTFEPPAPHLRAALLERTGTDIGEAGAKAAIRAEIAYYRAHLHEGTDPEALHDLRVRCAAAMGLPFAPDVAFDALMALAALPRLRGQRAHAAGAARARHPASSSSPTGTGRCTSACRRPGWRSSSTARSPRPRSAPPSPTARSSRPRSALAGTTPDETWHVGDTPEADVEGARAARNPPGPDRARAERAPGAGPIARRAHTLALALITNPRSRLLRRLSPVRRRCRSGRRSPRCSRS